MALPAVGDLHRAFFSASKTAAWPLQTLPCSVQWPFHLLSCKGEWLCQLSGICIELFFSASKTAAWPLQTLPCSASRFWNGCLLMPMAFPAVGDLHRAFFSASKTAAWPLQTLPCSVHSLLERLLANAHGFGSCQGSAQSLFFRFQDCRLAPSNPSLQRPVAFPPVVLQTPMALPAVGDLHSAFLSNSKTAAWPLQTLPCSVLWQMPMVSLVGGDLHRALFSGSNAQTLACSVKWPLERLRAKANGFSSCRRSVTAFFSHGFASCRGSAQSLFFRFQDCRLAPSNPSLQRPVAFPPVVLQRRMALPAVADLHSALFFRFPNCRLASSNPFLQRLIASCRGSAQSPFFPLPRLPLGPFKPFSVHSLLERLLATWLFQLSGLWTESFFFRFQDCRSPSNPSLQRPEASPPVVLQMPLALPAVGDLHRAFFSASKTATWPLQTLPCSVQWPFHLLSCKRQWLCQLSGICTVLLFSASQTAAWPRTKPN